MTPARLEAAHAAVMAEVRAIIAAKPLPGQRGFQPGCGCCSGPVEDRCCCHIHQDIPRGLRAHKCSIHTGRQPRKSDAQFDFDAEDEGSAQ